MSQSSEQNLPCPCGKPKSFSQCCGQFISGQEKPKTVEQLMRSRYSAYALGGYGHYLLDTWFPITARGLSAEELSIKSREFKKLQVLEKSQQGDEGMVEFKAYYSLPGSEHDRDLEVLHEVSEFRRIAGKWFYVGGRVE